MTKQGYHLEEISVLDIPFSFDDGCSMFDLPAMTKPRHHAWQAGVRPARNALKPV
jgi:hypothetical protein